MSKEIQLKPKKTYLITHAKKGKFAFEVDNATDGYAHGTIRELKTEVENEFTGKLPGSPI